ncbi:hypothetical protein TSMEX_008481 [Taenia solium]|eukprot:TsM_000243000 transcript=TsM_000243000 gene=TsM_000243000
MLDNFILVPIRGITTSVWSFSFILFDFAAYLFPLSFTCPFLPFSRRFLTHNLRMWIDGQVGEDKEAPPRSLLGPRLPVQTE